MSLPLALVLFLSLAGKERAGVLEWLSPDLKTVLAFVQLPNLGIVRYAPEPVRS